MGTVAALVVAGLLGARSASAADRFWVSAGGGAFGTNSNWSTTAGGAGGASAPVAADVANFTLSLNYPVAFAVSATNTRLDVEAGTVNADLGLNTYTLTSGAQIGLTSNAVWSLINGTMAVDTTGDTISVGASNSGVLTVSSNAFLGTTTARPAYIVANAGISTLNAINGGRIVGIFLDAGFGSGTDGTVNVSGSTSSIDISSTTRIGRLGSGTMVVSNGATATLSGTTSVGDSAGSTGTLSIVGSATTWTGGGLTIGNAGTGTFSLSTGATATTGNSSIGAGVNGVGVANITGTWNAGNITVGSSGQGTLTLFAAGTVTAANMNISTGGDGEVNVTAGSDLLISSGFNIASNSAGSLNINTGGFVSSGASIVGGNGTVTTGSEVGTVFINGTNSAWQVSSNLTIGIGNGVGIVTVNGGGALTVAATNTLNKGTLNIETGGVYTANNLFIASEGVVNLRGGTMNIVGFSFTPGGRNLNFESGTLNINTTTAFSRPMIQAILGVDETLNGGQTINVNSSFTSSLNSPITIAGGVVGGNGAFTLSSALNITSGGIDSTGTYTTTSASAVSLSGTGRFNASIVNQGLIVLDSHLATISGTSFSNFGTLRGTGNVSSNTFVNQPLGVVNLRADDQLRFTNALINEGTISLIGGELEVDSTLTNVAATGLISARDAILHSSGIQNAGSLAFSNGTVDVYGDVAQTTTGRITVSNGGIANFYDDVVISPGAPSVQATAIGSTVSRVVFFGSYNGGLTGGGQAFIEGDHRPGNSPGLVTFTGDVSYGPFATLHEELAGVTRGSQYDALNVSGIAQLQGTLDVTLLSSFDPAYLTYFDVINAGSVVGKFSGFNGRILNPQKYLVPVYTATQLRLAVAIPGDANIDGTVGFDDLLALAQNYNDAGAETWQTGDFGGDEAVGFDDLLVLAQNYGAQVLTQGEVARLGDNFVADWTLAQSLVPEPTSGLAASVLAGLAGRRRRDR